jgi:tetratricopeptide (TPR) repeat protein
MAAKAPAPGWQRDIDRAIALHRGGNLDAAARLYEAVLAADPDQADALHSLGVLHHQRGQSDHAIASIERAIRLAPEYADAHNNLGNVLKELGRLEPAFRAYRRVVELVPGHADAWSMAGCCPAGCRWLTRRRRRRLRHRSVRRLPATSGQAAGGG